MSVTPLLSQLTAIVSDTFAACGFDAARGRVVMSARPDLAQFQCNGAMACAKEARKNPMDIAEVIAQKLREQTDLFAMVEVAKPGFLNLKATDAFLSRHANAMKADEHAGGYVTESPQKVVIDYGGPNVAKPMHVGHLRACVLGNSIYRLFAAVGHDITSDIHLGDWGLPMGMLITEVKRRGMTVDEVTLEDLEVMYPQAASACKEDEARAEEARQAVQALQEGNEEYRALWRRFVDVSVAKVKENLDRLDVDFDLWQGESDVQDRIPPMVKELQSSGLAYESEGAWVIDVAEEGDKNDIPPMLLLKKDGAALYSTTDLATIQQRRDELSPDLMLYVVDQRQHLHFEQVFRAAKKAGYAGGAQMEHIGFGTVNGKDGKPFKTREGGVMKLVDLIDMCVSAVRAEEGDEALAEQVGVAALKFADLSSARIGGYVFDVEKFVSTEGRTGPYLQYACVRIQSMIKKSAIDEGEIKLSTPEERELLLACSRLPLAMKEALDLREPSILAEYAYQLAQSFSRFYAACPIARADDPQIAGSRMALSALVHAQLAKCLHILGIHVPERM